MTNPPPEAPQWGPPPPPKQKHTLRNVLLAVGALVLLLVVGGSCMAVGALSESDVSSDTSHSGASQKQKKDAGSNGSGVSNQNSEAADVKVKTCDVGDPYGIGETLPYADLAITNNSSKTSDYYIELEVTDPSGKRVDTLIASAERVASGQTVDEGTGDGLEDGMSSKTGDYTGAQPITCKILSVDRMESY